VVDEDNGAQLSIPGGTIRIPRGQTAGADTAYIQAMDDDLDDDAVGAQVNATSDQANAPATPTDITITDNDDAPGAPSTPTFSSVGAAGFTVEWTSPAAPGTSAITHYEIRYSSDTLDDDDDWMTVSGGASARTHAITGLEAGTTYNVEVRAVSAAGDGTASPGSQATSAS
ncbi:MAG: fibronectin type III domain-containing protein, partial [Gemmatimonadota bacterium]|nr:fibronectin type III domain-containing protein [Gemmatimonadota bacterium]